MTGVSNLRKTDLLVRIGGDKFIVLLPDANDEKCAHVVDCIHADPLQGITLAGALGMNWPTLLVFAASFVLK